MGLRRAVAGLLLISGAGGLYLYAQQTHTKPRKRESFDFAEMVNRIGLGAFTMTKYNTDIPAGTDSLLELIRRHEGGRAGYDAHWGGLAAQHRPPHHLTTMTVAQVLAWQNKIRKDGAKSTAAGAYQIIYTTLKGMAGRAVNKNAIFNETTQDKLAIHLLKARGLDKFIGRRLSSPDFAHEISKEWASFPATKGTKRGRSYYAGDGLNTAHVSIYDSLNAVEQIRRA